MKPAIHDNMLTPDECHRVIEAAQRLGLNRSTVAEKSGNTTSTIRTSSHVFLPDSETIAQTLKRKVHHLTGVPLSRMEQIQVVQYQPGQEYKPHFDACNDGCDSGKDMPRTETVMFYLNTVEEGGHTRFPQAGVSVQPRQGRAVHWYNIDDQKQNLPCSFHGADPVIRGEKWGATVWIR
jgi:prolyl 4-hydroxylase